MIKKTTKCMHTQAIECQQSLVFYFMRTARWVALLLLVGIGSMDAVLQFQRQQNINWIFVSICILSGVILFWIGHCIMRSECASRRDCGTCNKAPPY